MDTLSRTYTLKTALRIDFEALGDGAAHRIAAAFQEAQLDATSKITARPSRVQITDSDLHEHERILRSKSGGDSFRGWWHVIEPYLDSAVGGAIVYYGATQSSLVGICVGAVILCRSVAAWVRRDA